MFKLLDIVRLKEDDLEVGVKKTYTGTIVDVLGNGEAFTVEFIDENGDMIEKAIMKEYTADQLILVESYNE